MSEARVLADEQGRVVCAHCEVADTMAARMRGLLGRDGLDAGHGLLISPSSSIHMFFMRFAIDAVFIDKQMRVKRVVANLRPWRIASSFGSRSVLELPAGTAAAAGLEVGTRLAWHDHPT